MMKPILIDALHIKAGGAFQLLEYLIISLNKSNINYVLLKDVDCPCLICEDDIKELVVMPSNTKFRSDFFKNHRNDFRKILCFGNIPPCVRMKAEVYTYMHNVSLLYIPTDYSIKRKFMSYLKRLYISYYARYTDSWIVQTSNTANLLKSHINCNAKKILLMPFFKLPAELAELQRFKGREDYCFIGEHTNAKGDDYLVEAWALLGERGFKKKLHLTLAAPEMVEPIKQAVARGANIENHGHVPFEEVIRIYSRSKAIVYPSLNESLGLGIIEAVTAGCDVIGSDLAYIHSVCEPSVVFTPRSPEAIVDAILKYEAGECPTTKLLIEDHIEDLIKVLK